MLGIVLLPVFFHSTFLLNFLIELMPIAATFYHDDLAVYVSVNPSKNFSIISILLSKLKLKKYLLVRII